MQRLREVLSGIYDIEAELGRGGMGYVYLARDLRLDRRVALKVLDPELAADAAYREQFLREARMVACLSHPNIVPIFRVGEMGGFVFFTMAYVAGETLQRRVTTYGPLAPAAAARVLCDIGEALAYAHAHGVIHRDVKPANILLDDISGRALLTDFGIAHHHTRARGTLGRPAAPAGSIIGTAPFMSPEQSSGEAVDGRSDIYALGVAAYYALSGRVPFVAKTEQELFALQVNAAPPPLRSYAPLVPPRLAEIVHRCLAKQPWERFPDAAALVRAITEATAAPAAPLAIRAFLVRSTHLEAPALIHACLTGVGLLPLTVVAWLDPGAGELRIAATLALAGALVAPVLIAVARVRRLLEAGHGQADLVRALAARQARRREELAFVYGMHPTHFERTLGWLTRAALAGAIAAVASIRGVFAVPEPLVPLLLPIAAGCSAIALLAAIVSRARTEQRTDPLGERALRFWRGACGRLLFRIARGWKSEPSAQRVVTVIGNFSTPA